MAQIDDSRIAEAKAIPISEVAEHLGAADLKRAGRELVGPCPKCGGEDRFSINDDRGLFNCRHCGGGDGIQLVELVLDLDFRAAVAWLVGDTRPKLSAEEERVRAEERERNALRKAAAADRARRQAIAAARVIWAEGQPARDTPVAAYLATRGLGGLSAIPGCLRFHPALRYTVPRDGAASWETIYTGPAMLASVTAPDGTVIGVHRTWIDLDRPNGKAAIRDGAAEMPAKKILGSKKGAAIRLTRPADRDFTTLVMGEGIETTLTACLADTMPGAAYWAGVDLGNMAGRRQLGEGLKYAGIPDLADAEAFVPPPWITRLVFIQDGDSEPRLTRAKLESGLRRARHHVPGLHIQIAHAGEGRDLNDVLMEATHAI